MSLYLLLHDSKEISSHHLLTLFSSAARSNNSASSSVQHMNLLSFLILPFSPCLLLPLAEEDGLYACAQCSSIVFDITDWLHIITAYWSGMLRWHLHPFQRYCGDREVFINTSGVDRIFFCKWRKKNLFLKICGFVWM